MGERGDDSPPPKENPVYRLAAVSLVSALLATGPALAQAPRDRQVMGDDVRIAPDERVHDLGVFGGDVVVLGEVTGSLRAFGGDVDLRGPVRGDVAALGGDVRVRSEVGGDVELAGGDAVIEGVVHGDVLTQGGKVFIRPPGRVEGTVKETSDGHAALSALDSVFPSLAHVGGFVPGMLFVVFKLFLWLGACLLALLVSWFDGLRFTTHVDSLATQPGRALGWGTLAVAASGALCLLLAVTILGIPLAMLVALLSSSALYLGLGIAAAALGSVLPFGWLRGRARLQLCVGGSLLAAISLAPWLGWLVMTTCAMAGVGAVVVSHRRPPESSRLPPAAAMGAFL
jgi:hypothetical protein